MLRKIETLKNINFVNGFFHSYFHVLTLAIKNSTRSKVCIGFQVFNFYDVTKTFSKVFGQEFELTKVYSPNISLTILQPFHRLLFQKKNYSVRMVSADRKIRLNFFSLYVEQTVLSKNIEDKPYWKCFWKLFECLM